MVGCAEAQTLDALEGRDIPAARGGRIHFKHIVSGFGTMEETDLYGGLLKITDLETGQATTFADAAALVAAGWGARLSMPSSPSWHTALPWPLAVIDFEASSLDQDGYPIEVGLALAGARGRDLQLVLTHPTRRRVEPRRALEP